MKKKTYIVPDMIEVKVNTESHLLDASSIGFSESEYSSGGVHRSRESSGFWEDDEE